MTSAILPASLAPSQPEGLERLGPLRDGGYLLDPRNVVAADGLISMGVDRDWRFEREFVRRNRVPVHAYDGCTNVRYLLGDLNEAIPSGNWRWGVRILATCVDYLWFFSTSATHIRSFVGTADYAYEDSGAGTIPVQQVFDRMRAAGSTRPFLKIDVEGAEYAMLQDFVDNAANIAGLAIEFHNCDQRIGDIVTFVEQFPHTLVHIHANPYGGVGANGVPCALELTFSPIAPIHRGTPRLPHPLDRPNDGTAEIPLAFA